MTQPQTATATITVGPHGPLGFIDLGDGTGERLLLSYSLTSEIEELNGKCFRGWQETGRISGTFKLWGQTVNLDDIVVEEDRAYRQSPKPGEYATTRITGTVVDQPRSALLSVPLVSAGVHRRQPLNACCAASVRP